MEKRSNPIAKKLRDRRYKSKVVQSKKVYNRKKLIRETNFKGVFYGISNGRRQKEL